jgi:predicted nucleic acid-binding protein
MPKPRYYWDSAVFIALLIDEKRPPGELEGAKKIAALADRGEAIIYTSAISRAEVLGGGSGKVRNRFLQLFGRPSYVWVMTAPAIHDAAGDLRIRTKTKLAAADAVHLASAMRIKADALHTFDEDLLKLNGRAVVNNTVICHPSADQKELGLTL